MPTPPIQKPEVAAVFDAYPPKIRRKLFALRKLIFDTAAKTEGVGPLEETLKWGEPAYLPAKPKTGTTVRIDWKERSPQEYSMFFHCQTSLVSEFRERFDNVLRFEGNRQIVLGADQALPKAALASCIAAALTYHRDRGSRA